MEGGGQQKNRRVPFKFWEKNAKTMFFEVPRPSGFFLTGLELRKPDFDPFHLTL